MILHEFLPLFVGQALVDDILRRAALLHAPPATAFMPVEFQGAAYRFGHSMVRPSYRANLAGDNGQPFFGADLRPRRQGQPIRPTCGAGRGRRAGSSAGRRSSTSATARCKPNKLIDTKLSTPLFNLPLAAIASR